jgi:4-amino-4-deoxy-L-arabinose transferase-like glycosyltransferase
VAFHEPRFASAKVKTAPVWLGLLVVVAVCVPFWAALIWVIVELI